MEEFLNKLFDKHSEGYGVYDRKQIIQEFTDKYCSKQLMKTAVVERFSGEKLMKLQKHFVSLYGTDEVSQEKANSFAVGFGKACELIIKDLNAL